MLRGVIGCSRGRGRIGSTCGVASLKSLAVFFSSGTQISRAGFVVSHQKYHLKQRQIQRGVFGLLSRSGELCEWVDRSVIATTVSSSEVARCYKHTSSDSEEKEKMKTKAGAAVEFAEDKFLEQQKEMLRNRQYVTLPDGNKISYIQHLANAASAEEEEPFSVVLFNGYGSSLPGLKALKVYQFCVENNHNCLLYDMFGCGGSSGELREGSISKWKDDALYMVDHFPFGQTGSSAPGQFVLVGSSMGALIMSLVGLARPERISGCIGVASALDFSDCLEAYIGRIMKKARAERQASPSEHSQRKRFVETEAKDVYGKDILEAVYGNRELLEDGRQYLLSKEEGKLELSKGIPGGGCFRFLHGMQDEIIPFEQSLKLCEKIASDNIKVVLVKDGDHRLSRPEDLKLLVESLQDVIEDCKRKLK
eukprot:Nk52_evm55s485 gene=Nk52_evmTU55s485